MEQRHNLKFLAKMESENAQFILDEVLSGTNNEAHIHFAFMYSAYSNDEEVFDRLNRKYDIDLTFNDNILLRIAAARSNNHLFLKVYNILSVSQRKKIDMGPIIDLYSKNIECMGDEVINKVMDNLKGIKLERELFVNITKEMPDLNKLRAFLNRYTKTDKEEVDNICLGLAIEANRNDIANRIFDKVYNERYFSNYIMYAAKANNIDFLEKLEAYNIPISNKLCAEGSVAAATKGNVDVMLYLSNKTTDPEHTQSVILATISGMQMNDENILSIILADKADIHYDKDKALYNACSKGILSNVKILIDNCADIGSEHNRCLIVAAQNNHLSIVKTLIESGANIHTRQDCPLRMAVKNNAVDTVKYLLENGASVNECNDEALILAIKNKNTKIIKLLIEKKQKYTNITSILLMCIKTNTLPLFNVLKSNGNISSDVNDNITMNTLKVKVKDIFSKIAKYTSIKK